MDAPDQRVVEVQVLVLSQQEMEEDGVYILQQSLLDKHHGRDCYTCRPYPSVRLFDKHQTTRPCNGEST
jgi:hypothetical protein